MSGTPALDPPSAAFAADPAQGVFVARLSGHFRASDLRAAFGHERLVAMFEPGMAVLNDFSGAVLDLGYEEMRALMDGIEAIFSRAGGPPASGAFIAPIDVSFGLSRMYKLLTGDTHPGLEIFRNRDDAIKWLEVDPAVIEALESRLVTVDLDRSQGASPS